MLRLTLSLSLALSLSLLLLLPASGWAVPAAQANSLCVNQGGTGGCFGTITDAVAAAGSGDTILIAGAAGPYLERLSFTKSLNLVGDDPATTIIDGAAAGQVIRLSGAIVVTLSNLTIRNGQAGPGNSSDQFGGGIHSMGASLTLNNVVVSGNHTGGANSCCGGNGGGVYYQLAPLTLNHSVVSGNSTGSPDDSAGAGSQGGSGGDGAGIYGIGGSLTINDSTISNNFAGHGAHGDNQSGSGGTGGGIAHIGGPLMLNRSTVTGNASGNGGSGGANGGSGGDGGGIYSYASDVTVTDSTISYNGTGTGAAGAYTNGVSGNGAGIFAGAVLANGRRSLTIDTSTLSDNQTGRGLPNSAGGDGGGIYSTTYMTVTLTNVTLAYNSVDAGQIGGAIANFGIANVKNSLLAENSDAFGIGNLHDCSGTLNSLGYNVMMQPDCSVSPNPIGTTGDQFFVRGNIVSPLQDNGGPTFTDALPLGSIAIDAADNSTCSPTDQRGFPRPAFGGAALRCDIGAFELYRFSARLPLVVR
jgi:hypothetical protein